MEPNVEPKEIKERSKIKYLKVWIAPATRSHGSSSLAGSRRALARAGKRTGLLQYERTRGAGSCESLKIHDAVSNIKKLLTASICSITSVIVYESETVFCYRWKNNNEWSIESEDERKVYDITINRWETRWETRWNMGDGMVVVVVQVLVTGTLTYNIFRGIYCT